MEADDVAAFDQRALDLAVSLRQYWRDSRSASSFRPVSPPQERMESPAQLLPATSISCRAEEPAMSQDPYPSGRPSSGHANPYDGSAYGRPGAYPTSPYGQSYQPGSFQGGIYQDPHRTLEGEKAAQLSLIFGLVGLFVAGIILGPLAIWQANKAEKLGVPATAGKVLGWITTVLYGLAVLFGVMALILFVTVLGASADYSG